MTFASHFRFTWSGVFGPSVADPKEIWSCSVALGDPSEGGGAVALPAQSVVDAMVAAVSAMHGRAGTGISGNTFLTDVVLSQVGTNGRVARNGDGSFAQTKVHLSSPVAGGVGNPLFPWQIALAVSLQSNTPGRTGRGRFFLPGVTYPVAGDGRITDADVAQIRGSMKTFVNALNSAQGGSNARVVIASGGSVNEALPPANRLVTSLRVGRVYDTLRTRRNQLQEAYSATAIP